MAITPDVVERLTAVRARIAEAAATACRRPHHITLLPVSKTHKVEDIAEVAQLGHIKSFGENRPQELAAKAIEAPHLDWVLIGPLQRNKAALVAAHASQFQALDSLRVAEALDRQLQALGRSLDVMIEVNTSGEPAKHGVPPSEALKLAQSLAPYASLNPIGLMTLAAQGEEPQVRGCFQALRTVQSQLRDNGHDWPSLSMGMSNDYVWAIEEGATVVRLGTAIFGPRPSR